MFPDEIWGEIAMFLPMHLIPVFALLSRKFAAIIRSKEMILKASFPDRRCSLYRKDKVITPYYGNEYATFYEKRGDIYLSKEEYLVADVKFVIRCEIKTRLNKTLLMPQEMPILEPPDMFPMYYWHEIPKKPDGQHLYAYLHTEVTFRAMQYIEEIRGNLRIITIASRCDPKDNAMKGKCPTTGTPWRHRYGYALSHFRNIAGVKHFIVSTRVCYHPPVRIPKVWNPSSLRDAFLDGIKTRYRYRLYVAKDVIDIGFDPKGAPACVMDLDM